MTDDDLAERVDELEDLVETLFDDQEGFKQNFVLPQLNELKSDRDDLAEQVSELQDDVAYLSDRVRELETGIENVIGLAEDQTGGPDKRASDLALGMIRTAQAKPDTTVAAKHWEDVQDFFAEHGHGEVSKPLCFNAMHDLAELDGFEEREKSMVLPSGREGLGIFVDLEKLPASPVQTVSNDITTRNSTGTPETHGSTGPKPAEATTDD